MDAHTARVNDYFDQSHADYCRFWGTDRHASLHAGFYDTLHRRHATAQDNVNRVLADLVGVSPGMRVLDAGCGLGSSSVWLGRECGAEVVGVNINPRQLAVCRTRARDAGMAERVQFVEADFNATPFPDGSFDVVWGVEAICYALDKRVFLREAARLLRPGGWLVVSDVFLRRPPRTRTETRWLAAWCDGWAVPQVGTVSDFTQGAADAGLTEVIVRDATSYVRPASRRMVALTMGCYPGLWFLEKLGLRTPVQNAHILSGWYQFLIGVVGLGLYGIVTARKPPVREVTSPSSHP